MDDSTTADGKANEKNTVVKTEEKEIKRENIGLGSENSCECSDKIAENNNVQLKEELLDNVGIKRELSEGEASSGFETVSSVDSNVDSEVLDLSSTADEEDFNVVVEIENELAYKNHHGPNRRGFRRRGANKPLGRYNSRTECFLSDYTNRRHDSFRSDGREPKYWRNSGEETNYKYDRRDRVSSEREAFGYNRRHGFRDQDWERNISRGRRRGTGRRCDCDPRLRCSRSPELIFRSGTSRSSERNSRLRSPSCKDRKTRARSSRNFDRESIKSDSKRDSPPRKRRRASVWKRLETRASRSPVNSTRNPPRKKERTPFLVELERKLKEATELKNSTKGATNEPREQREVSTNVNETPAVPEMLPRVNQNPAAFYAPTYAPPPPNIPRVGFPYNYTMPTMSVNNLPLVPGPTGVPVHITMTGEQIPHDFDGKPVPVGPNGHYLPLDPTGRLFAHIVSPGNQAVPIHMTEDGVLRLPNSEPVPYGPLHQLPVNIDGRVIPIGSDSKPLSMPCPDLPRQPPLNILKMMNSFPPESTPPQGVAEMVPQTQTEPQQRQTGNQDNFQAPRTDCTLVDGQNPSQKTGKADSLKNSKKVAGKTAEDMAMVKIFDANASKRGIKRSMPMKLSQKKIPKDDIQTGGSDVVLDSDDSGCASGVKSAPKRKKDSAEEIVLSSDDDHDILNKICDKEKSRPPKTETKPSDKIVKRVQQTIQALCERDYNPPVLGRFIISNLVAPVVRKCPNASPLVRNRIILPFLIPNSANSQPKNESPNDGKTEITFKFLPQKILGKGEESSVGKSDGKDSSPAKAPAARFDFAVQCDLSSDAVKQLSSKVTELEVEIERLRNTNSDLLEDYRNAEIMNERKSDELRKAMLEIRERKNEIQALKNSFERRRK